MDLVIDAGNTRIKLAYFDKSGLRGIDYVPSSHLNGIYKVLENRSFEKVILGTVFDFPPHIIGYLKNKGSYFLFFDATTSLPILVRYDAKVGSDRVAQAVAAASLQPGKNILIIGAGTCITYNFLTAQGEYTGGAISPGLNMRLQALNQFTGRLPLVELAEEVTLIGQNTSDSILSGVINGALFEIEGFIDAYSQKYPDLHCILCGGDSRYIAEKMKKRHEVMPELGLTGLHKILEFNAKTKN